MVFTRFTSNFICYIVISFGKWRMASNYKNIKHRMEKKLYPRTEHTHFVRKYTDTLFPSHATFSLASAVGLFASANICGVPFI